MFFTPKNFVRALKAGKPYQSLHFLQEIFSIEVRSFILISDQPVLINNKTALWAKIEAILFSSSKFDFQLKDPITAFVQKRLSGLIFPI